MRVLAMTMTLVGGLGLAGCYTPANLGGTKVRPLGAIVAGATCSQSSDCASGLCLGQTCCTQSNCGTDATCQGTSCDATGACVYPAATTACVAAACAGHTRTEPASCDGLGSCANPTPATQDCAPYVCGGSGSCRTSCTGNADCTSARCDVPNQVCCAAYVGNQIEVDGTQGVDQACCGAGVDAKACATIAHAVALAGQTGLSGITVHVANPPSFNQWSADSFPIQLSYGVILSAPGVHFIAAPPAAGVFSVAQFTGDTSTSAVLEGTASEPLVVEMACPPAGDEGTAMNGITIEDPMTLNLLHVGIHGICVDNSGFNAIQVNPGATLALGTDGARASGTVEISGGAAMMGVVCQGSATKTATISDDRSAANPSLVIHGQTYDIYAQDGCQVRLAAWPVFGPPPVGGSCPAGDWEGIFAQGTAIVAVSNALFQCFYSAGIFTAAGDGPTASGPPSVTGDKDVFQYDIMGVDAAAGSISLTNSTFSHNRFGISVGDDGWSNAFSTAYPPSVDLSGGGNVLSCNGGDHWGSYGGDLRSELDVAIDARNVTWDHWDPVAGHTRIWACSQTTPNTLDLGSCTCSGDASCPAGSQPLPNNADAVYATNNTHATPIDDTGGSASTSTCP